MPRAVCVQCEIELRPKCNDTALIEMASFGAYRIWLADLWACPHCGIEIVSGYGKKPVAEHFEPDFDRKLEAVKLDCRRVVYAYERGEPKEQDNETDSQRI